MRGDRSVAVVVVVVDDVASFLTVAIERDERRSLLQDIDDDLLDDRRFPFFF